MREVRFGVGIIALGALAWGPMPSSQAVEITEVLLDRGTGLPDLVEIRGLPASDDISLVVLDAKDAAFSNRWGKVRSAVTLDTSKVSGSLVALSESALPSHLPAPADALVMLDGTSNAVYAPTDWSTTSYAGGLDLGGARLLVLLDGVATTADANAFFPSTYTKSQVASGSLDGLTILDTLAFSTGPTATDQFGNPLDPITGDAMVRPDDENGDAGDVQSGTVDAAGTLSGTSPALAVTPGRSNPVWSEVIPEPSSGVAVAVLGVLLAVRPQRRASRHAEGRSPTA